MTDDGRNVKIELEFWNRIRNIVVFNCQKCNQCLKCQVSGHKSLGLFYFLSDQGVPGVRSMGLKLTKGCHVSKSDEFSEKGGGPFSIQKFILQNLDLEIGLFQYESDTKRSF